MATHLERLYQALRRTDNDDALDLFTTLYATAVDLEEDSEQFLAWLSADERDRAAPHVTVEYAQALHHLVCSLRNAARAVQAALAYIESASGTTLGQLCREIAEVRYRDACAEAGIDPDAFRRTRTVDHDVDDITLMRVSMWLDALDAAEECE